MRYGAGYLLLATLLPGIPSSLTAADADLRGYLETHCFDYIATNFLGHGTVNPKANESDD